MDKFTYVEQGFSKGHVLTVNNMKNIEKGILTLQDEKPFSDQDIKLTWDGNTDIEIFDSFPGHFISDLVPKKELLLNSDIKVSLKDEGVKDFQIKKICKTIIELDFYSSYTDHQCVITNGLAFNVPAIINIILLTSQKGTIPLLMILNEELEGVQPGIYGINSGDNYFTEFSFTNITVNDKYNSFFASLENNIHIVEVSAENPSQSLDFSLFKPGDIVFGIANTDTLNLGEL